MVSFDLRKVFNFLVGVYLFFGCIFYIPVPKSVPLQTALEWGYVTQELFFRYGALFLILVGCSLTHLRSVKPYLLLSLFACFFVFALMNGLSIHERRHLLNLGIAIVLIKTIAENADESIYKVIGVSFLLVVLVNLAFCVFQYFGVDGLHSFDPRLGKADRVSGLMKIKVHLGVLSAIAAPFLVELSPFLVVVALPLLYFGKSSAAVAGLIISLFALLFLRVKKRYAFLISAMMLAVGAFYVIFFDMPGGQFDARFEVWSLVFFTALKMSPIIGSGIGSFAQVGFATGQETVSDNLVWLWAHNEYLQVFFEGGIIAIFLIFMYLRNSFSDFFLYRERRHFQTVFASFLVILGVSFFHFPMHIARLAIPCVVVLALLERERSL